jgi:hypothetical protein
VHKKVINHLKGMISNGSWSVGCKFYHGKPWFGIYSSYYDGENIAIHLGPFWLSVNYITDY